MTTTTITNFQDFRKWKEDQAAYVKDRWGTKELVEDGLNQIRLLGLPNFYPFVLVFQWVGTTTGPLLQLAFVTMNHFPAQNDRLQYLDNLILETKKKLNELAQAL